MSVRNVRLGRKRDMINDSETASKGSAGRVPGMQSPYGARFAATIELSFFRKIVRVGGWAGGELTLWGVWTKEEWEGGGRRDEEEVVEENNGMRGAHSGR